MLLMNLKNIQRIIQCKWLLIAACLMMIQITGKAQQKFENAMSQYFHNRSLLNPAFTGMDGNKLQVMQNRSWVGFEGAPVLTVITSEFNFGDNSGIGGHIFADKSGIVYRTTGVLNYAYRIKLNKDRALKLGIGFTVTSERLDPRMLEAGAAVDPVIAANINGKPSYDGNFGILYTTEKLNIGATFFRISENLSKDALGNADLILMKGGIFYNFNPNTEGEFQLKPLAMISIFKNLPAVFDGGAQAIFNKYFNAMAVYQTTGNIRAGVGISIGEIGEINLFYNTNNKQSTVNAQQYEFGFKLNLPAKKKD